MPNYFEEPNMSDTTILLTVEDLINRALGPPDMNVVNFKIIQTILEILARQQRILEHRVEIKVTELKTEQPKGKKGRDTSTESSSSKSPPGRRRAMAGIKEEHERLLRDQSKGRKSKDIESDAEKDDKTKAKAEKKEKEKDDKLKEKEEKLTQKEDKQKAKEEKQKEKEEKHKEKAEKKEKEKADKAAEKEKVKLEKEEKKEKERAEKENRQILKEHEKASRERSPASAKGSKKKGDDKVVVVEKGPTTRTGLRLTVISPDDSRPRGSIEVVTQSQFALLEAAVKELTSVAAPKLLQLPDNEKLKSDLAKGTASLPDAMQTLQVDARVKAAEGAILRMTGLLTQLAAAGALPEDIAEQVGDVEKMAQREAAETVETADTPTAVEAVKSRPTVAPRKSVAIDPKATQSQAARAESRPSTAAPSSPTTPRPSTATTARPSLMSKPSQMSTGRPSSVSRPSTMSIQGVTYDEMNAALRSLRDDVSKNLNNMTFKATTAADTALHTAKTMADKVDVALKLDSRISTLYSLVTDYAEQLSGFDSGLTTQMQSFQDQMAQMRTDLKSGLAQLENVNNNAETAAVMELTERFEELATELDTTLHAHKSLTALQTQLSGEMHSLVQCVEMLREQKCDRDEVLDGLRDKADTSRLAGLLTELEFAEARADFERRIDLCHDKFRRQDAVWTTAIRDLTYTTDKKAEIVELLSARDEAQRRLQELDDKIRILAAVLGEPKAALLTRKLAAGATCGACQAAALMAPCDAVAGAPARLPALRPPPVGASDEPCIADWVGPKPADDKHTCHRWCGGSHTLISESTQRQQAPAVQLQTVPTKKFTDYGSDGRLYMFEEELQPCAECNVPAVEQTLPDYAAGDAAPTPQSSLTCTCPLLR